MALTLDDRPVRRLTADEVMRMVEHGILESGERVELLDGILTEKPVKGAPHSVVQSRLLDWAAQLRGRYAVRADSPLVVPDDAYLPEPDLAVIEPTDAIAHPTTALLVVEVAQTSLRTDLERKPALYASADVPDYWVVDVAAKQLVRFSDPDGGAYGRSERIDGAGTIRPLAVDAGPLDLPGLFAGL